MDDLFNKMHKRSKGLIKQLCSDLIANSTFYKCESGNGKLMLKDSGEIKQNGWIVNYIGRAIEITTDCRFVIIFTVKSI